MIYISCANILGLEFDWLECSLKVGVNDDENNSLAKIYRSFKITIVYLCYRQCRNSVIAYYLEKSIALCIRSYVFHCNVFQCVC